MWVGENDIALKSHQPSSFPFNLTLTRADMNEMVSISSVVSEVSRRGIGMWASEN